MKRTGELVIEESSGRGQYGRGARRVGFIFEDAAGCTPRASRPTASELKGGIEGGRRRRKVWCCAPPSAEDLVTDALRFPDGRVGDDRWGAAVRRRSPRCSQAGTGSITSGEIAPPRAAQGHIGPGAARGSRTTRPARRAPRGGAQVAGAVRLFTRGGPALARGGRAGEEPPRDEAKAMGRSKLTKPGAGTRCAGHTARE